MGRSVIITSISRVIRQFRNRPRLAGAAVFAGALFIAMCQVLSVTRSFLLAFDIGAALFLFAISIAMTQANVVTMRRRAQLQNEGKWTVLALSMAVSGVLLISLYLELHATKNHSLLDLLLASSSIFLSWLFIATIFALHYAHSFYLGSNTSQGGLLFPGTDTPDYWDFMYFSIVLSMACQVSDVQINDQAMRRVALLHSMMAFFFNVIIIAITVSMVAGVL